MTKTIYFLISLFILGIYSSTKAQFEIVYMAEAYYINKDHIWLRNIKNDWNATGINLVLYRADFEHKLDEVYNKTRRNATIYALNKIADSGLSIYIRINMGISKAAWFNTSLPGGTNSEGGYTIDDIHQTANNVPISNGSNRYYLNLTSEKPRNDMFEFVDYIVNDLLQDASVKQSTRNAVKMIIPTLTPDDETEYPSEISGEWGYMSGFSDTELDSFLVSLQKKYSSITNLNNVWKGLTETKINNWNSIKANIHNWNWEREYSVKYYKYLAGRKDFIDFRTGELKKFIDKCAEIVHGRNIKFGVQFGSIYDAGILLKGFYEVTPLLENVDHFVVDDILEYVNNWDFAADYARSVCNYWNRTQSRINNEVVKNQRSKMTFSTESNWPGYNNYSSNTLNYYWGIQLQKYYEKGASSLFISHWGSEWGGGQNPKVPDQVKTGLTGYNYWKTKLEYYKNKTIKSIENDTAIHLSCEQSLYSRNASSQWNYRNNVGFNVGDIKDIDNSTHNFWEFPLYTFTKPRLFYNNSSNETYRDSGDFITNFMIANSPDYLESYYNSLKLNGTSYYIPDNVSQVLNSYNYRNFFVDNETYWLVNNRDEFIITPGTRNERYKLK